MQKSPPWRQHCAACGATDELHIHHLVPRSDGGAKLPTVMLCLRCHGLVHGRDFSPDHRALTIAGLARAKARGVKLGGPNLGGGFDSDQSYLGRQVQAERSKSRAAAVLPHIDVARFLHGAESFREIAAALMKAGIPTPSGRKTWHASQVRRILNMPQRSR